MIYLSIHQNKQDVLLYYKEHNIRSGVAFYDFENQAWFELEAEYDEEFDEMMYYYHVVPDPLPAALMLCVF